MGSKFDKIIEEISKISDDIKLPEIDNTPYKEGVPKLPNPGKKRNENNQSKIAGKYFKGLGNSEGKVVSDQDKKKNTRKGSIKRDLDQNRFGYSRTMSMKNFEKMLNDSGDRSLNLSDNGEWKSLNSKTGNYKVKKLSNGRVRIKKFKEGVG